MKRVSRLVPDGDDEHVMMQQHIKSASNNCETVRSFTAPVGHLEQLQLQSPIGTSDSTTVALADSCHACAQYPLYHTDFCYLQLLRLIQQAATAPSMRS